MCNNNDQGAEKTLRFHPSLIPQVLSGEKTSTWRINDEKNLSTGDRLIMLDSSTDLPFAKAVAIASYSKPFAELTEADKEGHERFESDRAMYDTYSVYYNAPVGPETVVKIVRYALKPELKSPNS